MWKHCLGHGGMKWDIVVGYGGMQRYEAADMLASPITGTLRLDGGIILHHNSSHDEGS